MDSRITRNHNILDLLVHGKTDLLACGTCRICQKHVQFPVNKMQYEAAARALEKLATDLRQDPWGTTLHDVDSLRSILRTRAAALRAGEEI